MRLKPFFSAIAGSIFLALTITSSATAQETVLYNFHLGAEGPYHGVISDGAGNLYGTAGGGGRTLSGTVFELTPNGQNGWRKNVIYEFPELGSLPNLITFDSAGKIFGTTEQDGAFKYGTVYELSPMAGGSWTEKTLYNFTDGKDGGVPFGGVLVDPAGNLYGTTNSGGAHHLGVVYELSPQAGGSWKQTVLHAFANDGVDGASPVGNLFRDAVGNLYGATYAGGAHAKGSVFKLSLANGLWTETILHSFPTGHDGQTPFAGVVMDSAGNLYGTTYAGGNPGCSGIGCGVIYQLAPSADGWTENILHSFKSDKSDGYYPENELTLDAAGNIYGTTTNGGSSVACGEFGCGTVFELSTEEGGGWTETILQSFDNTNGNFPHTGLTFDASGNLYGTTLNGGAYGDGVVFKLTP
jgi:uncharacterized repeat protein (TIGR03803 family)